MSWNNSFNEIMNFVLQSSTEFVGILLVNSEGILQNSAKYPGPSVRDWQDVAEQPDILWGTQRHRDTWNIRIKYSLSVIFLGYQSQIYLQLLHETLCWSLNHTIEPVSPSLHQSHLFNLKKPLYHSFREDWEELFTFDTNCDSTDLAYSPCPVQERTKTPTLRRRRSGTSSGTTHIIFEDISTCPCAEFSRTKVYCAVRENPVFYIYHKTYLNENRSLNAQVTCAIYNYTL